MIAEINAQTVNRLRLKISATSIDGVEVAAAAHCSITKFKRFMELLNIMRSRNMKDVLPALAPDMDFSRRPAGDGGETYFNDVEDAVLMLARLFDKIAEPMMLTEVDETEWSDRGGVDSDNLSPKTLRLCDAEPL